VKKAHLRSYELRTRRCSLRNVSNRLVIATAVLLLLAGLLWFGGNLYLSGAAQRVAVISAAVDIPRGTVLTTAMLGTMDVPRGTEGGYARAADTAVGKVARVDILAGTALTARMLAEEPPPPGRLLPAGTVLAPGLLAVAVPLDPLDAAGGALQVGDRVTIYAATPPTATADVSPPPLATHVRVLDLYTPEGNSLLSGPAGRSADVALLEAAPDLADLLMEASRQGRLRLALEGGEP
jgi:Flp pilus assembly protein CpaB